ncbi:MAG TPA: hypothetical protein VM536_08750 [Chloroflexia bacterium]|nr:hypothetical protein [Chloroflexia bacterium]
MLSDLNVPQQLGADKSLLAALVAEAATPRDPRVPSPGAHFDVEAHAAVTGQWQA